MLTASLLLAGAMPLAAPALALAQATEDAPPAGGAATQGAGARATGGKQREENLLTRASGSFLPMQCNWRFRRRKFDVQRGSNSLIG